MGVDFWAGLPCGVLAAAPCAGDPAFNRTACEHSKDVTHASALWQHTIWLISLYMVS